MIGAILYGGQGKRLRPDSIRIQPNVPHTIVATEDTVLHEVSTSHIDNAVRIKDFYERNNN